MNFDRFVAACRAEWPCFDDPRALSTSQVPKDRSLARLAGQIDGMATENKLKLLNLAAASLENGEVYVEVGCYKGLTIAGAALNNPRVPIFACDDFSQFNTDAATLEATLAKHTAAGQVRFFDMEFRGFLSSAPWRPAPIGAYFYDGAHRFADQYDALRYAAPWLAQNALVIVDDTNKRNVRSANRLFARRTSGFELVLDLRTPRNHHPTWWNGVQLYRYRAPVSRAAVCQPGFAYAWRRLLWDDLFLRSRHLYRAQRALVSSRMRRHARHLR